MKNKLSFSKQRIETLPTPAKRATYHDTQTRGLCLRVEPTGSRSFVWIRKVAGRPAFKSIGMFPDVSLEIARTKADEYNAQLGRARADGFESGDPFRKPQVLTLAAVFEDYIERHIASAAKNPPCAAYQLRCSFGKHLQRWKTRKLNQISKADVLALYSELKKDISVFTANRVCELLATLYNWATNNLDWAGANPAKFRRVSERPMERTRFLQSDELPRLFRALETERNRDLRDFVILSLLCGARKSDTLGMRWQDLNLSAAIWTVPKPKSAVPYNVPLLPQAVMLLKERKASNRTPWVFPNPEDPTRPIQRFRSTWEKLLKRAEIRNFRFHDLRRTCGSVLACNNVSLPIIASLLGHTSLSQTHIYARLQDQTTRAALEGAAKKMLPA